MKHARPPLLATWMLEHLTPADRDEALAGDLLEDFRSGRSDAWYWRQTLAACAGGWLRHLGDRRLMLTFAALWSMLAPTWLALEIRIVDGAHASAGTWRMDGQFSGIVAIGLWLLLNLGFIWAGMSLYFLSHPNFAKTFSRETVLRALLIAAPIFFFAYFGSFVLANLYSFPGPLVARSSITPLGELTDLRGWADLLRVPYFITLVCALWATTASRKSAHHPAFETAETIGANSGREARALTLLAEPEQWSTSRFFGYMLAAGLLNATIAAWIVCRLPDDYFPSLASLLFRAVFYVAITAIAGVAASRFYWNRAPRPPASAPQMPFAAFALTSAAAWVWIPSAMLLSTQNSPSTAIIAAVGAAILAYGLRKAIPSSASPPEDTGMFVATLREPSFEAAGYIISACFYLALLAFADRQNVNASAPLAVCAFVLAWNLARAPHAGETARAELHRAAVRLARTALPAILLTVYALLMGIELRNAKAAQASAAAKQGSATANHSSEKSSGSSGVLAYQSVVLWPFPPDKQQIVAPAPAQLLVPGSKKPLVIRFQGPYLYFQAPNTRPGPHAHQARGNPLSQPIVANNFIPLVMEARQNLASEIPLSHCREIDVAVDYREDDGASVSLALLLAESAAPGSKQLFLGRQLVTSEWGPGVLPNASRSEAATKILRFPVPATGQIRSFNQIVVMFLTDRLHSLTGPKIAVKEFRMLPR